MKEIYGNAWDLFESREYDILFITTNGFVKSNGNAVMGRGIAAECAWRYPTSPSLLGKGILQFGNIPLQILVEDATWKPLIIASFPVKYNWWEQADIELIKKSCSLVMEQLADEPNLKFLLPRPGCGNGHLSWEQVKKEIELL